MKKTLSLLCSFALAAIVLSTSGAAGASAAGAKLSAAMSEGGAPSSSPVSQAPASTDPRARDLRWRNIGPANMMGRIAAIEALSTDYRHVLVASASGGVFKSWSIRIAGAASP